MLAIFVTRQAHQQAEQEGIMKKFQCSGCGYIYDEALGDKHEGYKAGTLWSELPEDWACPDCAVRDKTDFSVVGDGAAGGVGEDMDKISTAQ